MKEKEIEERYDLDNLVKLERTMALGFKILVVSAVVCYAYLILHHLNILQ